MSSLVNAGPRLDRLPIGPFHYRIMWLIGIGMFFDGFDIYIAATVLGATLKSGFSTFGQNALFVSATFVGMMVGSFLTGFLGDRYGRRFTYQANLLLFGLASLAAAFAPNMEVLIGLRFLIGVGLGAENVVGYSTLTEFVPAHSRGRWLGLMAVFVVTGLPAASLLGYLIIPEFGWRAMFIVGGLGGLVVWYMRKKLPESPRWLESVGRTEEAEHLLKQIEAEASRGKPLPPPAAPAPAPARLGLAALFRPPLLSRMIVGCICLIVINTLLYGFITWLPTFFIKQGLSIATSFGYSLMMGLGAPVGSAIGALTADRWGRKPTIIVSSALAVLFGLIYPNVSDPTLLPVIGFALTVPIYVLVALLFGIYIPELFPTEVRLRASGICNTFGRGATIVTPFIVVALFETHGISGVMVLMISLLILQIAVVALLGIEPRNRRLEELEGNLGGASGAPSLGAVEAGSGKPS
ncbi:MAG TPA: MFS transporter [Xanthobacteraceae bacterium]|nr:MAG: MFS transporter [Rhizobiales bacterium 12-66-7]HQS09748.1 MFS transporter [Xanthobacteraceae bacterium]HQS48538.1 MFS transporter [Xanthobacteraceae bacterium]